MIIIISTKINPVRWTRLYKNRYLSEYVQTKFFSKINKKLEFSRFAQNLKPHITI